MSKFISEKQYALVIEGGSGTWHASTTCSYLTRKGSKAVELNDEDWDQLGGRLRPCPGCAGAPKLPKEPRTLPPTIYPTPIQITVWRASDGRDFTTENEALWYELELVRSRNERRRIRHEGDC